MCALQVSKTKSDTRQHQEDEQILSQLLVALTLQVKQPNNPHNTSPHYNDSFNNTGRGLRLITHMKCEVAHVLIS